MPCRPTVLGLVGLLALAGCGGGKSSTNKSAAKTTASTTTAAPATTTAAPATTAAGCEKVAQPRPRPPQHLAKPTTTLSPSKTWTVKLDTSCGEIDVRLDVKNAPKTTGSVASLVRRGFYDGLSFHRVVADFVIQGGDPQGNGQGGPGYTVVERPPGGTTYKRRVVAMAKAQVDPAGASGSQFFIVTAQDVGLPPIYALVGRVVGSMSAVDKISANATNPNQQPLDPVVIKKATLVSS